MNNTLIQKLSCADVYRTYVLLLITDKSTLTTDTTIDQLASFVGESKSNYKGNKKTKSFNDKLRDTGEVTIQKRTVAERTELGLITSFLQLLMEITEESAGSFTIHIMIHWI